ncbi:N-6 DNA methylase [Bacillus cereus]|nr:N-6 DNA methylase [Bacillus cereus]
MKKVEEEQIIKSKKRVQKHGEVFTPKKTVNLMLDMPGVKEACEDVIATFLEPAAGEGAFLVEVLNRKLTMISEKYNENIDEYENYALLGLSTLYGIELLEDNAKTCAMNLYEVFDEYYKEQLQKHGAYLNQKVRDSAKTIISQNITQGNFLTRLAPDGNPIYFSEWKPLALKKGKAKIKVNRTEYTLEEILNGKKKTLGEVYSYKPKPEQLDIFSILDESEDDTAPDEKAMRYIPVNIIEVYKEEMEEPYES